MHLQTKKHSIYQNQTRVYNHLLVMVSENQKQQKRQTNSKAKKQESPKSLSFPSHPPRQRPTILLKTPTEISNRLLLIMAAQLKSRINRLVELCGHLRKVSICL